MTTSNGFDTTYALGADHTLSADEKLALLAADTILDLKAWSQQDASRSLPSAKAQPLRHAWSVGALLKNSAHAFVSGERGDDPLSIDMATHKGQITERHKEVYALLAARIGNPNYTRHINKGCEVYSPPRVWEGVERARLQMLRQEQTRRRPWSL